MTNSPTNDSQQAPAASGDPRAPEAVPPSRMDVLATLPVFFKLGGRRAILAGGTEPAVWKAELLSAAGAELDVYATSFAEEFSHLAAHPPAGRVTLHKRAWTPADLDGAAIAVGALTDDADAAAFAEAARRAGVPVNVIDRPAFCQFQFGSIVNRSPLVIAISTDGAAPVFGQAIRSRIEALLPQGFKRWAEAAKIWRREGSRLGEDMPARRRFWERFTERAITHADRQPTRDDLESLIAETDAARSGAAMTGFVTLVGAGPGDPELLTLKAVRALRAADVILYDDLVTPAVLDFARRESKRILVGKTGYGPACKQSEINALMLKLARQGQRVVRLKSGDPMIFGRGGEEMADLDAAGIPFEVIPGISAAQAAASRLKASLTHRDFAKRVQFVTGHARDGRLPDDLDWKALADPKATTAVYMAMRTLKELGDRLIAHGLPADTPAYALLDVTRPGETIVRDTVAGLAAALAASGATGPCLVLFGEALRTAKSGNPTGAEGAT